MKITCLFYIAFQLLKVLLIHRQIRPPVFYVLLFLLAFTSADIIFYKFLKLHSALPEEKIFRCEVFLFNGFNQTPHSFNGQNPLSVTKVFC